MHGRRRALGRALPLLGIALGLVVTSAAAATPAFAADARLVKVGDFDAPTFVTAPPGDRSRLFVVEQPGTIRVVRDGAKRDIPFLDIASDVLDGGERGLLSMAFAPDYGSSGRFYVYFTDGEGDIRIEELRRSGSDPDRADPATRRLVIEIAHREFANHNGGQLQFGPDGLLYAGTGDGGGGGDPFENAQNPNTLLGKLLRIDPAGVLPGQYNAPADNPFAGGGGRPEVFSIGLRNPWRFSFDRQTADLTLGDVGQGAWEEIDFVPRAAGGGRGVNFGWDCFEGNASFEPCPAGGSFTAPVLTYANDGGTCAVTGGYVVRDTAIPSLFGRYLYADYCAGALRTAVLAPDGARDDRRVDLAGDPTIVDNLSSFGEDAGGCVYVASSSGPVFRLAPESGGPGCPAVNLAVGGKSRQRVLKRAVVRVSAVCNEPCSVRATGTVSIKRVRRRYRLRAVERSVGRFERAVLELRVPAKVQKAIRKARARRRTVTAVVRVEARDATGETATLTRRAAIVG